MSASAHPVAAVLRARRAAGSRPGARDDGHRVALVLEGGGMRGVVSAGMAAALERLGLADGFDLVVGSSAGAINGAALVGGVARTGAAVYAGAMASRQFVNPARLLIGRPALDVRVVLDYASPEVDERRHERALASPIELHCVAVDVATARPRTFTGMRTKEELWAALLATTRMPWVGGDPVVIGGRRYVDGALAASIPLAAALEAGATHVLVLQTRPHGVPRTTGSRLAERMIERHLARLNPALVELWRTRAVSYDALVGDILRQSTAPPPQPPYVLGLRPPAGTPVVGQLERRSAILASAEVAAERLVEDAFGSDDAAPALRAAG